MKRDLLILDFNKLDLFVARKNEQEILDNENILIPTIIFDELLLLVLRTDEYFVVIMQPKTA